MSDYEEQEANQSLRHSKPLKLKDGDLKIVYIGYKLSGDKEMIAELQFTFDRDAANPRIVELNYNKEAIKNSQFSCENALETILELEDCHHTELEQKFPNLVRQEIYEYKKSKETEAGTNGKPTKEYHKPSVERINADFYLIGPKVYLLNHREVGSNFVAYAEELSEEDVRSLPLTLKYSGPQVEFSCNEKEFIKLYGKILMDFNKMQDLRFVSFPLAGSVAHLAGEFYKFIIEDQGNFSTQMVLSGSATGTGKSLLMTIMVRSLKGCDKPSTKSCSESEASLVMSRGENLYVKEFSDTAEPSRSSDIDLKFLKKIVQTLWEKSSKKVRGKEYSPAAVCFIDANSTPDVIIKYVGPATATKMKFLATGSQALEHEDQMEMVESLLANANELYKYLPVFLSIGRNSVMKRVTTPELSSLSNVLKVPKDVREGQLVRNYDRFYLAILELLQEHVVELPPVFASENVIDRRSLLFYNSNQQEQEDTEVTAKMLLGAARENGTLAKMIDFSGRTSSFRIKISDLASFPPNLERGLRKFKVIPSSTFRGQKARVVEFAERLLSSETARGLKAFGISLQALTILSLQNQEKAEVDYGERFSRKRFRAETESDVSDPPVEDPVDYEPDFVTCEKVDCKYYGAEFTPDSYKVHVKYKLHIEGVKTKKLKVKK